MFFSVTFRLIEKSPKDQADIFSHTFPLMEKCAKDQADGKCSRTGPYAPTVGPAPARSVNGPMVVYAHCKNTTGSEIGCAEILHRDFGKFK